MIDKIVSAIIGAFVSFVFAIVVDLWKARGRRDLYGEWWSAVQPVYYDDKEWHIQKVNIKAKIIGGGIIVKTKSAPGKLQWKWDAKLVNQKYLVGRWKSSRSSSISNGYMSVQAASNGKFMFGHDYGDVTKNRDLNFGVLLLGRSREDLESAWNAVRNSARRMLPLTDEVNYPEGQDGQTNASGQPPQPKP